MKISKVTKMLSLVLTITFLFGCDPVEKQKLGEQLDILEKRMEGIDKAMQNLIAEKEKIERDMSELAEIKDTLSRLASQKTSIKAIQEIVDKQISDNIQRQQTVLQKMDIGFEKVREHLNNIRLFISSTKNAKETIMQIVELAVSKYPAFENKIRSFVKEYESKIMAIISTGSDPSLEKELELAREDVKKGDPTRLRNIIKILAPLSEIARDLTSKIKKDKKEHFGGK
jgi:DNA repair exonuclease SbcCD ATPase subunit